MRFTYLKTSLVIALALTLSLAAQVRAEETASPSAVSATAVGVAGTSVSSETNRAPKVPGGVMDSQAKPLKSGLKKEYMEGNKDLRNKMIEDRKGVMMQRKDDVKGIRNEASSTLRTMREERKAEVKNATSSAAAKEIRMQFRNAKGELLKKARKEEVTVRQTAIVTELNVKIKYLHQVASRIDAYLTKLEGLGRSTEKARLALDTATKKISAAEVAVGAVAAWKPSEVGAASSTEVSLTKPRAAAEAAIVAIKAAAQALQSVMPMVEAKSDAKVSPTTEASPVTTSPAQTNN